MPGASASNERLLDGVEGAARNGGSRGVLWCPAFQPLNLAGAKSSGGTPPESHHVAGAPLGLRTKIEWHTGCLKDEPLNLHHVRPKLVDRSWFVLFSHATRPMAHDLRNGACRASRDLAHEGKCAT
jgi:hypothetical protein